MTHSQFLRLSILSMLSAARTAVAQDAPAPTSESIQLETVIVTGSHLRGSAENAALPVEVISAEDLANRGSPSVLELVKSLSSSSGVLGDSNQFDSRGAQGTEGTGSVNLRGLGPQRTLVLLNGRRLVNNPLTGAVDTNTIPLHAIGRVEVLKDGAAATYGSDAIAGVVNFITKETVSGFDFAGGYNAIEKSDGNYNVGLGYGFQGDRLSLYASLGYDHRSELKAIDRDFAHLTYDQNPEGGWSGGGSPSGYVLRSAPTAGAPLGTTTGTLLDPSCGPIGGFPGRTSTNFPVCNFQFTVFDNLVERQDRYQGFVGIALKIGESAEWRTEAMYSFTDVPEFKTSPSYLTTQGPTGQSLPSGLLSPNYYVPASNPGVQRFIADHPTITTFQGVTGPSSVLMGGGVLLPPLTFRPFGIGGNPLYDHGSGTAKREYRALRFSTGLKGSLTDGLAYDLALTYSDENIKRDAQDTVATRLQLALRGFGGPNCPIPTPTQTAGAGVGNCFYFNPFGNAIAGNRITGVGNPEFNPNAPGQANTNRELIEWFFQKYPLEVEQSLGVADLVLSGSMGLALPGGDIGWAAGAQYRKSDYRDTRVPVNDVAAMPCVDSLDFPAAPCTPTTPSYGNGVFVFLPGALNEDLSQNVYAAFTEFSLPLLESINGQLAVRYEHYDKNVGSTLDPKLAMKWQASDSIALRASVGTTFRGPPSVALAETVLPALQNIFNSFRSVDLLGNPDLKPEKAFTYNVGAILETRSFNATLDYFNFRFKDPIVVEPILGMVNTMFPGGAGDTSRCGDPVFAELRARFTFTAAGCAGTNVARVRTYFINGSTTTTDGIDFSAQFDTNLGPVSLATGIDGTYVLSYEQAPQFVAGVAVSEKYDAVGKLNVQTTAFPLPKLRSSAFVNFALENHNLRLVVNYIHSYEDQRTNIYAHDNYPSLTVRPVGTSQVAEGKHVPSWTTFDAHYAWNLPAVRLGFSVLNIADRDPPFTRTEYNYDTFTANPLGRVFRFSLGKAF